MSRHRQRERSAARPPRTGAAGAAVPGAAPRSRRALRQPGIDALRGGALCLMFVYHFAFDLRFFHVISADFEHDAFWLGFRALIVTSFLLLAGVSLMLARQAGTSPRRFWRRIALIGACALAVSAASYLILPRTFIYFGILHCIAVASVLAWPFTRRPLAALVAGLVVIAAGMTIEHAAFDARPLSWLGFATRKPATEDYVPLAPWLGVVLVGIACGHALLRANFAWLRPLAAAPAWLWWLGRNSLAVYMAHQPILMTLLWLLVGR